MGAGRPFWIQSYKILNRDYNPKIPKAMKTWRRIWSNGKRKLLGTKAYNYA
ncbi:MAG: hypothetical protein ACFFG0_30950 [Candidatus Thorarchaeota archaeon]